MNTREIIQQIHDANLAIDVIMDYVSDIITNYGTSEFSKITGLPEGYVSRIGINIFLSLPVFVVAFNCESLSE